jgi:spore germination protein KC
MLLTGCWSRRELNSLGIVVGVGIDKSDKQYEVSIQIVNPGEISSSKGGGGSDRAPVTAYSSKGNTVAEAIRKLSSVTPRKSYFSHVRMVIMSEALAREGISETLDYLSRNHEFRTDFYFAISRGMSAQEMLSVITVMEKIPSNRIYNTLAIAEKEWSPVTTVQLDDLIKSVVNKGNNPVLTGIRLVGDLEASQTKKNFESIQPLGVLQPWGLAVFHGDRMVGWLNEEESKGFSDLTNKLKRSVLNIACPTGGYLAVDIIRSETKVKGLVVNGKPKVDVSLRTEANVSDVECKIDLAKGETLSFLEQEIEKEMKKHGEASVKKAKLLKTDIFSFGEAIHRAEPVYWSKVKEEWNRHFAELTVDIKVDARIRRLGTIGDPIMNKTKE